MESLNNKEDSAPTRYLLPPSELSSARNGLYLVEVIGQRDPMENPKQQVIVKVVGCDTD